MLGPTDLLDLFCRRHRRAMPDDGMRAFLPTACEHTCMHRRRRITACAAFSAPA